MDRLREFEEKKRIEREEFAAQQKREEERRMEVLERVAAQDGLFRQHMHEKLMKKVLVPLGPPGVVIVLLHGQTP